ncbi:MAG: SPOR domain-containing protein [Chlorobiota bacterium]|nr:MAG: SPOR domain-containing protein [Chlorobiota bacterium]
MFEESEDGFQKVHPVSNAFKDDDAIPILTPFSEEPDLFSDLGLHPEKEEDRERKESIPLNEEPELVFTHSSIVIDDSDDDDEDDYTVFQGGIKVTPPEEEEVTGPEKEEESIEEFIESLVDEVPESESGFEAESEVIFEPEAVPEEMSVPEEVLPADDMPEYEPVAGSDHFEVVEEQEQEPDETPEEQEETPETAPEPLEEPSEDFEETPGTIEEVNETVEEAPEVPVVPEPALPYRRQRISIFDDLEEETEAATVVEPVSTISVEQEDEVFEEIIDVPVVEETEEEAHEEPALDEEPDLLPAEEPVEIDLEMAAEVATAEEVVELAEDEPEITYSVEETTAEPEITFTVEETAAEPEPSLITEEDLELPEEEPPVPEEELKPETSGEVDLPVEEPVSEEPAEAETPDETRLLFDEDFFDEVVDPEVKDEPGEKTGVPESIEQPGMTGIEPEEQTEPASEEVFHHISRDSIISTEMEAVEPALPVEEPVIPVEQNYQISEETNPGITGEEKEMGGQKEEKSPFSVLGKMLLVLGLMVATWYVLDSSGLLKGKRASLNQEDLALGSMVITDSNSLSDKREYPFNRDTQNDGNLKGTIFKDGKYFEVAENGVLTAVDYDTSSQKKIKVTVPPDSLLAKDTKKEKKEDTKGKGKDKEKDKEKTTNSGNITLQDAVKNKVKENKIADHVFKSGKKFFVQISAHRSFDTAEKIALDLKKKGYSSFVMKVKKEGVRGEDGVWYRVRIGPYDNETKALEVNKIFNKNKKS